MVLVKVDLMSTPAELISIGEVSRRSGKAASAIRYHEEIGDAARGWCPTLDDCPLFEEPERLPERAA